MTMQELVAQAKFEEGLELSLEIIIMLEKGISVSEIAKTLRVTIPQIQK